MHTLYENKIIFISCLKIFTKSYEVKILRHKKSNKNEKKRRVWTYALVTDITVWRASRADSAVGIERPDASQRSRAELESRERTP